MLHQGTLSTSPAGPKATLNHRLSGSGTSKALNVMTMLSKTSVTRVFSSHKLFTFEIDKHKSQGYYITIPTQNAGIMPVIPQLSLMVL